MPKGMILAAGRGTRLGHLTAAIPKPLLPVANVPVMTYGIQCLHHLGIDEICINVHYRAEQIQQAFSDLPYITWAHEKELTGTAGGMKKVERHLSDDIIVVIAGDAMLDIDLTPMLNAHRERGAFASIATYLVDDPSQYGVVVADDEGRIQQFQEKPKRGTEISNHANTGIYIFDPQVFELIPADVHYDFALDVFPEILRRGLPFYAFPTTGYWTDIGNPGEYMQANLDYLLGNIKAVGLGRRQGTSLVAETAHVDGVTLHNSVVGSHAHVAAGCVLHNSVVWPGARL
ncbi:MAG: sugar phosphate nucleotidyltransferase, partial [bacterium]